MKMRLDSRGGPLRRTYLGNLNQYTQGKRLVDTKNNKTVKKLKSKQSVVLSLGVQAGQNIVSQSMIGLGDNTPAKL